MKRFNCKICGDRNVCVPMGNGDYACTVCIAHTAETHLREHAEREGTKMDRINFAEEVQWAERHRHLLFDHGQRGDFATAEGYVENLFEKARGAAVAEALRETAAQNGLRLDDYPSRLKAGAIMLEEEPGWRGDAWRSLSPNVRSRIERHYHTVKNAEDAKARHREQQIPATRPDPTAVERERELHALAGRLGVDSNTKHGRATAAAHLAARRPDLFPLYGRRADVIPTDAAAERRHAERFSEHVVRERTKAEQPDQPVTSAPPVGGHWF